jgi:hypothetical protein
LQSVQLIRFLKVFYPRRKRKREKINSNVWFNARIKRGTKDDKSLKHKVVEINMPKGIGYASSGKKK